MLFFTCIKPVVRVLACAHTITRIKWRRLEIHFFNFYLKIWTVSESFISLGKISK